MKKILLIVLFICGGFNLSVFADGLAQEYSQVFGTGIILASGKGLPAKTHYDTSQFIWRDGKFFLNEGASATVNFRAILPEGTTYRKVLDRLKSENQDAAKRLEEDLVIWNIWVSHKLSGEETLKISPDTLFDPSTAGEPFFSFSSSLEERQLDFNGAAYTWEQILRKPELGAWLHQAKPGYKIYAIHAAGFSWTTTGTASAGEQNNHEESNFLQSETLASCTIELQ